MLFGGRAEFAVEITLGENFRGAAGGIGTEQETVQHHVMLEAARRDSVFR